MDSDYIQLSTFRSALALTTANHSLPQPVNGFATYHKFLHSFNRRTIYLLNVSGLNEIRQSETHTAGG